MENVTIPKPKAAPESRQITRSEPVTNRFTAFWSTEIGKKIVMAITGIVLIGFVIGHMVGNLKIFLGPGEINAYASFLRTVGAPAFGNEQVLWLVRIFLIICVTLHITAAIQLTRMSHAARPTGYAVKRNIKTTIAAQTMRWGGVLLALFIVFHLLHMTGGVVGFAPGQYIYLDVYHNVVAAFNVWPVAIFYVIAMGALCLHLSHGIWSMLQTLGFNTARNEALLKIIAHTIAIIVFLGFSSVPVAVMTGWLH